MASPWIEPRDGNEKLTWGVELELVFAFHQDQLSLGPSEIPKKILTKDEKKLFTTVSVDEMPNRHYNSWGVQDMDSHDDNNTEPYDLQPMEIVKGAIGSRFPNIRTEVRGALTDEEKTSQLYQQWIVTRDSSVCGVGSENLPNWLSEVTPADSQNWDPFGVEIVSPVFDTESNNGQREIGQIVEAVKGYKGDKFGGFVTNQCGLHVHVQAPPDDNNNVLEMLATILIIYEEQISRLTPKCRRHGHENSCHHIESNRLGFIQFQNVFRDNPANLAFASQPPRNNPTRYQGQNTFGNIDCSDPKFTRIAPTANIVTAFKDIPRKDISRLMNWPVQDPLSNLHSNGNRNRLVNFTSCVRSKHRPNTIEFRQQKGSLDPEYISHWVDFCVGLVRLAAYYTEGGFDNNGFPIRLRAKTWRSRINVFDLIDDMGLSIDARRYWELKASQYSSSTGDHEDARIDAEHSPGSFVGTSGGAPPRGPPPPLLLPNSGGSGSHGSGPGFGSTGNQSLGNTSFNTSNVNQGTKRSAADTINDTDPKKLRTEPNNGYDTLGGSNDQIPPDFELERAARLAAEEYEKERAHILKEDQDRVVNEAAIEHRERLAKEKEAELTKENAEEEAKAAAAREAQLKADNDIAKQLQVEADALAALQLQQALNAVNGDVDADKADDALIRTAEAIEANQGLIAPHLQHVKNALRNDWIEPENPLAYIALGRSGVFVENEHRISPDELMEHDGVTWKVRGFNIEEWDVMETSTSIWPAGQQERRGVGAINALLLSMKDQYPETSYASQQPIEVVPHLYQVSRHVEAGQVSTRNDQTTPRAQTLFEIARMLRLWTQGEYVLVVVHKTDTPPEARRLFPEGFIGEQTWGKNLYVHHIPAAPATATSPAVLEQWEWMRKKPEKKGKDRKAQQAKVDFETRIIEIRASRLAANDAAQAAEKARLEAMAPEQRAAEVARKEEEACERMAKVDRIAELPREVEEANWKRYKADVIAALKDGNPEPANPRGYNTDELLAIGEHTITGARRRHCPDETLNYDGLFWTVANFDPADWKFEQTDIFLVDRDMQPRTYCCSANATRGSVLAQYPKARIDPVAADFLRELDRMVGNKVGTKVPNATSNGKADYFLPTEIHLHRLIREWSNGELVLVVVTEAENGGKVARRVAVANGNGQEFGRHLYLHHSSSSDAIGHWEAMSRKPKPQRARE